MVKTQGASLDKDECVTEHIFRTHVYAYCCEDYNASYTFCIRDKSSKLLAVGTWLNEGNNRLNFHSFASLPIQNIGAVWLSKSVEFFIQNGTKFILNMTTGCDFLKSSYDTYKKLVSNQIEIVGSPSAALTLNTSYGVPVYTDEGFEN